MDPTYEEIEIISFGFHSVTLSGFFAFLVYIPVVTVKLKWDITVNKVVLIFNCVNELLRKGNRNEDLCWGSSFLPGVADK